MILNIQQKHSYIGSYFVVLIPTNTIVLISSSGMWVSFCVCERCHIREQRSLPYMKGSPSNARKKCAVIHFLTKAERARGSIWVLLDPQAQKATNTLLFVYFSLTHFPKKSWFRHHGILLFECNSLNTIDDAIGRR